MSRQHSFRTSTSLLLLALCVAAGDTRASTVVITFDSLDASGGQVSGPTLDAYLAGFGVTVSHVAGPAGPAVANAATPAFLYPQFFGPPSKQNFIWQPGSNGPVGYRLNFPQPLLSLSFTRAAMDPEQSITGMIAAEWTARVLDSGGNTIGTVGEPNYGSYVPVDAATFTFSTPGIVALVVERSKQIVSPTPTTVTSPPLDNLTFVTSVPEPAGLAAAGAGVLVFAAARRLRRGSPGGR